MGPVKDHVQIAMEQLLSEFYEMLDAKVEEAWSIKNSDEHLVALVQNLQFLCEKTRHIGNYAFEEMEDISTEKEEVSRKFINYQWMPQVKTHLVLWRDIIFETQKAMVLHQDNEITENELQLHIETSGKTMTESVEFIKNYFGETIKKHLQNEQTQKDFLTAQSLITNPWPVYQEQINVLEAQSHSLYDQYQKVSETYKSLKAMVLRIHEILKAFENELSRIRKIGEEAASLLASDEAQGYQKLIRHITNVEEQALAFNHANTYTTVVQQTLATMVGKVDVPIRLEKSRIVYKEIDFEQGVKVWLHGEIRPHIIEAQEILDSIGNSMKMALINVKNRVALLSDGKEDPNQVKIRNSEYAQPLYTVLEMVGRKEEEVREFNKKVRKRILNKLHLNRIYLEDRVFLDSSQQYMLSQLKMDQTAWIQRMRNWVWAKGSIAKDFMANVAKEESLSLSEKLVRYINSRKSDENNIQYANIFSTRGYIGESFWVGREEERRHVVQIIEDWKRGYRGSVVVSGKRLCGKTVFGELIAHRFFPEETIRLKPFTSLKFGGRSIMLNDDIREGLDFIRKYLGDKKLLIWIDDLETWQSVKIPSSQNVRVLLENIDQYSTQLFFMVSMSNWFRHHYNQMFQLGKVFQAEINLDYMTDENIRKAIMIRHGATHKILVDEELNKVASHEFNKIVLEVSRAAENNIGQALNLWSYFTKRLDDERVVHRADYGIQLPNFLNDENSILLRAVLMSKRTNEYRLRKTLGRAFGEKYRTIVMRLIALGILVRHMDGLLEINESIVNEVAAFLEEGGYLRYKLK